MSTAPSPSLVREELDRILASDIFLRSERLSAFLKFIVEETLDGHAGSLKEQVIAVELYGKKPGFNTAEDPIVRVDARRLRDRLREYYASAPRGRIVISVPKGSYTPAFVATDHAATGQDFRTYAEGFGEVSPKLAREQVANGSSIERSSKRLRHTVWIACGAIALMTTVTWLAMRGMRSGSQPPIRLLTVTSFPGAEGMPSFSPDGNFVTFTWTGPQPTAPSDVWVKSVDGEAVRRLTDTPLFHEAMPRWSPDGRHIVFYRQEGTVNKGVYIVSPLGGPERRIAERGGAPSWTPDSRSLVMLGPARTGFAVFEHVLETGARRQLTRPPNGFSDISPQVSPDGATLAFVRSSVHFFSQAAVFVVPMSGGEPKRLTEWSWMSGGIAWTPDGREILFPRIDTSGSRVYRMSADGRAPPRVVPDIPIGTNVVSISGRSAAGTFRVAFTHGDADVGLQLVDLHSATSDGVVANVTPFCPATRMDTPGRFSHDGRLVAFTSDRGGNWQVWLTAPTGAGLRSVPGLERPLDVGSWSPDRRFFAVDAIVDDHVRVYIMAAEDGRPRRLTQQSANESDPQWSRDGRWIYYASDASGRSEIWKIPSGGGKALQITTDGAFEPREAPDGASIYYIAAPRSNGLRAGSTVKQVPVNGAPREKCLQVSHPAPGT